MIRIETLKINQTIVHEPTKSTFFSYDTPIVSRTKEGITLHTDWNYSRTTAKYRSQFLGETTPETKAKLVSGEYAFKDYYAKD